MADILAYKVPAGTNGDQTFAASLGMSFTPTVDLVVDALASFVNAAATWTQPKTIHISPYALPPTSDVATLTISVADLTNGNAPLTGQHAVKQLGAPVTLTAGTHYMIWQDSDGGADSHVRGVFSGPGIITGDGTGNITYDANSWYNTTGAPAIPDGDGFDWAGPSFAYHTAVTVSFSIAPTTGPTGTPLTITATGTGTSWVNGTTAFSVTGGTGASISALVVNSATSATFTLNPGSAAGTLTIHDSTDAATATFTATVPAVTIFPDDAALLFDPGGWDVTHARAFTNAPGNGFDLSFEGTSCTGHFDVSHLSAGAVTLKWSIAGGPAVRAAMAATVDFTQGTPLSTYKHHIRVEFVACNTSTDRWSAGVDAAVYLTSITLDNGAVYGPVPGWSGQDQYLIFGDSIAEGYDALSGAGTPAAQDAGQAWPAILRRRGIRVGVAGYSGLGFTVAASSVPAWPTSCTLLAAGVARSFAGLKYVVVTDGVNDAGASGAAVQAAIASGVAALVAAGCPASKIVFLAPFTGTHAVDIQTAALAAGCKYAAVGNPFTGAWGYNQPHPTAGAARAQAEPAVYAALVAAGAIGGSPAVVRNRPRIGRGR